MVNFAIPLPEKFKYHRQLVTILRGAEVLPPARWLELDAALEQFLAIESTATQELAEQIVNPRKNVDVRLLRAMALAEQSQTPGAQAAINAAVVAAVSRDMLACYEPVAKANYAAVAAKFNRAAETFTKSATVVDPEMPAVAMVNADDDKRTAWLQAEAEAATLTALVAPLLAATQLTGTRIDTANEQIAQPWWDAPIDDAAIFGLTVDANGLHRRKVWQAFDTDGGRAGRWAALVALGAVIRAPKLDDYQPYRRPLPLRYEQRQVLGAPRGTVHTVEIDPEDPGYVAPVDLIGEPIETLSAW